jgi:hypothetical protein
MEKRPRGPEEFRIIPEMNAAAMQLRAAEEQHNTAPAQGQKAQESGE